MSLLRPAYGVEVRRVMPTVKAPAQRVGGVEVDPRSASKLVVVQGAGEGENPVVKGIGLLRRGLRWLINGPAVQAFKSFKTYDDPDTRWANGDELRAAMARIKGSVAEENAAIAKLGARGEGYRQLAQICGNDPMARDALLRMLLDGRLGRKDLIGRGDLLDHLIRAAKDPLVAGVDRQELVTSLIEETENPVKISQEGKGTCVATSATIVMARKDPAEYARLVADLARPEGSTTTVSGVKLTRAKDFNVDNDYGRTPSLRLLQPALMEYGNGWMRYNNEKDMHALGTTSIGDKIQQAWQGFRDFLYRFPIMPGGLSGAGANKVLEALTGDEYAMIYMVTRLNRGSALRRVQEAVAAGKTVPVGLEWEGGGHKVLVDKIENGTVYLTNPWGERDTLSWDEFSRNLMDANIPK